MKVLALTVTPLPLLSVTETQYRYFSVFVHKALSCLYSYSLAQGAKRRKYKILVSGIYSREFKHQVKGKRQTLDSS